MYYFAVLYIYIYTHTHTHTFKELVISTQILQAERHWFW